MHLQCNIHNRDHSECMFVPDKGGTLAIFIGASVSEPHTSDDDDDGDLSFRKSRDTRLQARGGVWGRDYW